MEFNVITGVGNDDNGDLIFSRSRLRVNERRESLTFDSSPAEPVRVSMNLDMSALSEEIQRKIDAGYEKLAARIERDYDDADEIDEEVERMLGEAGAGWATPTMHDAMNHAEVIASDDGETWIKGTLFFVSEHDNHPFVVLPDGERDVERFEFARRVD